MLRYNGQTSAPKTIVNRIPQGSIPGPVLFLLYINDLPDYLKYPYYPLCVRGRHILIIAPLYGTHAAKGCKKISKISIPSSKG